MTPRSLDREHIADVQQPFPNFNGAHGAPSTRDILFANIASDLPFLEDAVGSLERDGVSAVILQYSQGFRYMEDVEYWYVCLLRVRSI